MKVIISSNIKPKACKEMDSEEISADSLNKPFYPRIHLQ